MKIALVLLLSCVSTIAFARTGEEPDTQTAITPQHLLPNAAVHLKVIYSKKSFKRSLRLAHDVCSALLPNNPWLPIVDELLKGLERSLGRELESGDVFALSMLAADDHRLIRALSFGIPFLDHELPSRVLFRANLPSRPGSEQSLKQSLKSWSITKNAELSDAHRQVLDLVWALPDRPATATEKAAVRKPPFADPLAADASKEFLASDAPITMFFPLTEVVRAQTSAVASNLQEALAKAPPDQREALHHSAVYLLMTDWLFGGMSDYPVRAVEIRSAQKGKKLHVKATAVSDAHVAMANRLLAPTFYLTPFERLLNMKAERDDLELSLSAAKLTSKKWSQTLKDSFTWDAFYAYAKTAIWKEELLAPVVLAGAGAKTAQANAPVDMIAARLSQYLSLHEQKAALFKLQREKPETPDLKWAMGRFFWHFGTELLKGEGGDRLRGRAKGMFTVSCQHGWQASCDELTKLKDVTLVKP